MASWTDGVGIALASNLMGPGSWEVLLVSRAACLWPPGLKGHHLCAPPQSYSRVRCTFCRSSEPSRDGGTGTHTSLLVPARSFPGALGRSGEGA